MTDTDDKKIRGQIIKKLFDRCLDLSPEEQTQYVEQAEVSADIKDHVLKLLEHTTGEIDLTQAVVDSVQVSMDIKPLAVGMNIGAYELIKPLGEGGQGEVWLASRSDGNFHHQVAVKFLKPLHNQSDLNRFQSERELLAGLRHPNIAQLLDGGEFHDNRPYMVLELVEGLPLLEYCLKQRFTLKQYLTCFLQICGAISYAHSHSVIHRDIKPSNVYITHDGTVKLLDFGVAKFIDQDEVSTHTMPVMTLAYSSPEQVTGAPVSTATDVYSLGLLLYEMLTGQRAQAFETDVPAELIQQITQRTPVAPSQVLKKSPIKRSFNTRLIQGDLDNLILMAVRKEPERRYPTVVAMAKDVENYLDGKPLMAVGDSRLYLIRKFMNRNPLATYLSAAVLAFMVTLPLVLLNNQKQLKIERDKALIAQQQAESQTIIANRTTDFLVNILESASPLADQGEAINLDDVLASAERQLSFGLDEQPKIKATLLSKLAGIQHQLGNSKQAVEHYKTVLQLYEQENDESGQAYALGQLAVMSHFANNQQEALHYKDKAEAFTPLITDPVEAAWNTARIATVDNYLNKKTEVVLALTHTLEQLAANNIEIPDLLGRIYNELAIASPSDEAGLAYIEKAVQYAEEQHGKMHPLYQNRQLNKAQKLKGMGRYQEAEAAMLEVRKDTAKLFTKEHPVYSSAIAELGALYHDKGRFSEVEEIYLEAIKISQHTSGEKSLSYVLQVNNLAYLYEDMGRYEAAESHYRESVALRQKYHAASTMRVASSQGNLARLLAKMGQHEESESILKDVIAVYRDAGRNNTLNDLTAAANTIHSGQGDCERGQAMLLEIVPSIEQMAENSWRRMHSELWIGELFSLCQKPIKAKQFLLMAEQRSKTIYAPDSDGQSIIKQRVNVLLNSSQGI